MLCALLWTQWAKWSRLAADVTWSFPQLVAVRVLALTLGYSEAQQLTLSTRSAKSSWNMGEGRERDRLSMLNPSNKPTIHPAHPAPPTCSYKLKFSPDKVCGCTQGSQDSTASQHSVHSASMLLTLWLRRMANFSCCPTNCPAPCRWTP